MPTVARRWACYSFRATDGEPSAFRVTPGARDPRPRYHRRQLRSTLSECPNWLSSTSSDESALARIGGLRPRLVFVAPTEFRFQR